MTRVDFYLLPGAEGNGKALAACRLAQKAYRLKHRVYILTDGPDASANLDRLLWTFHPNSFVPHQVQSDPADVNLPVMIGHDVPPDTFGDVLISLTAEAPEFFDRFERVAEIVGADETERAGARERFRRYRDRGVDVQTHNL
ncbi:MAG TPA: DNA polymerase III subunit chi [Burkholderiales bacterium]|jgi:DNA polymerase-3 subunit chi|nr:DNA polymerase III subunit chi [Burkholderiales bacterium]